MSTEFARDLRTRSDISFSYSTYKKWRRVSSESCRLAGEVVPDLTMNTTRLNDNLRATVRDWESKGWGLEKISMHLLCEDVPEAAIGLYEKCTLAYLDKKYATKPHPKAIFRQHPAWSAGEKQWAPLYFRKHLVVAHDTGNGEIIVFNPAERNFCDGGPESMNERRRAFYERTWKLLSKKVFGANKSVTVRHMGVQGKNDCGVWIYLIPHLLSDAENKKTAHIREPQTAFESFVSRME